MEEAPPPDGSFHLKDTNMLLNPLWINSSTNLIQLNGKGQRSKVKAPRAAPESCGSGYLVTGDKPATWEQTLTASKHAGCDHKSAEIDGAIFSGCHGEGEHLANQQPA